MGNDVSGLNIKLCLIYWSTLVTCVVQCVGMGCCGGVLGSMSSY